MRADSRPPEAGAGAIGTEILPTRQVGVSRFRKVRNSVQLSGQPLKFLDVPRRASGVWPAIFPHQSVDFHPVFRRNGGRQAAEAIDDRLALALKIVFSFLTYPTGPTRVCICPSPVPIGREQEGQSFHSSRRRLPLPPIPFLLCHCRRLCAGCV